MTTDLEKLDLHERAIAQTIAGWFNIPFSEAVAVIVRVHNGLGDAEPTYLERQVFFMYQALLKPGEGQ